MATFRKRANAWQVRIQRSGYPEQSKSFKSRSEAVVWARKIESELDNGVVPQQLNMNSKVLLKDLLERYKSEVTIHKKHPAVEAYRINFWLRHSLANQPISSIKSSDIAKWREERVKLGRSPNTLRLELAVLSNLFTVAANEWGYEELTNPTTKVKLPKLPSGRVRRLGINEFELIIQNSGSTLLRPIAILAVETGMRRTEIASIEWEHINLAKRTLLIPITKNGEAREVPLSPVALDLLRTLKQEGHSRVFDITAHAISIAFGRACKRAKLVNLHFHDLRHEAISRLFERGLSLPEVATISGHKTWTMLRRYTHLSAESIAMKLV
ncbi:MAG: site-specific integrase [Methylotenera sp.]|nr:site-specific integrase [Methylotenera sp.]